MSPPHPGRIPFVCLDILAGIIQTKSHVGEYVQKNGRRLECNNSGEIGHFLMGSLGLWGQLSPQLPAA